MSGTWPRPSEKRNSERTADSRREMVGGRQLPAGSSAPEGGGVVGEDADVDALELAVAVPGGEVAEVGRIRAPGRLGDARRGQVALARLRHGHGGSFALAVRSPAVDDRFQALAELAVHGANVQPGQVVAVGATVGQEALARATADAAYRRGALFVDVAYFDPYVKRARVTYADPDDARVRAALVRAAAARARRSRRRRGSASRASSTRTRWTASIPRSSAATSCRG